MQIPASTSQIGRVASELRLLQQEALTDQAAIQLLLERESAGALRVLPDHPADWATGGAALGMTLALLFGWVMFRRWYVGNRAHPGSVEAPNTVMPSLPSASEFEQFLDQDTAFSPKDAQLPEVEADETEDIYALTPRTSVADTRSGQLHRVDTAQAGFDSEAAASDVMRVRQSLAQKRMARMRENGVVGHKKAALDIDLGLDQEQQNSVSDEPVDVRVPQPDDFLDSLPPEHWQLDDKDLKKKSTPKIPEEPPAPIDETISFSLPAQPASAAVSSVSPQESSQQESANPYAIDIGSDDPKDRDYTITLSLAYESEYLESWSAARVLASEVLESGDPDLMRQARVLLSRLDRHETVEVHEEPTWDDSL
ncbi:MAG: hypothetical protein IPH35_00335 [Rhodoferax sp.]|nr:hypothetical protein [Rhodoferax sp.]